MTQPRQAGVRVLGIDTALRKTGLGVVEQRGSAFRALHYGLVKNSAKLPHSTCLLNLVTGVQEAVASWQPQAVAIEGVYYFKNPKTAVILGQARGAVIAACAALNLPVFEYAPRRVKQAVVGVGSAQKHQMVAMMRSLLNLAEDPGEDEADALALALCHLHARGGPGCPDPL